LHKEKQKKRKRREEKKKKKKNNKNPLKKQRSPTPPRIFPGRSSILYRNGKEEKKFLRWEGTFMNYVGLASGGKKYNIYFVKGKRGDPGKGKKGERGNDRIAQRKPKKKTDFASSLWALGRDGRAITKKRRVRLINSHD